jgi:hypothetical protein
VKFDVVEAVRLHRGGLGYKKITLKMGGVVSRTTVRTRIREYEARERAVKTEPVASRKVRCVGRRKNRECAKFAVLQGRQRIATHCIPCMARKIAYRRAASKKLGDRIEARIGTRGALPEWQIRLIEEAQKSIQQ